MQDLETNSFSRRRKLETVSAVRCALRRIVVPFYCCRVADLFWPLGLGAERHDWRHALQHGRFTIPMPALAAFLTIFAFVVISIGSICFFIECGYVVRSIYGILKARAAARANARAAADREWRERVFHIDGREQF